MHMHNANPIIKYEWDILDYYKQSQDILTIHNYYSLLKGGLYMTFLSYNV